MRVIIAGSRGITQPSLVLFAVRKAEIKYGITITEVVSGHARGVDRLGERYAAERGIRIRVFEAQWKRFGRSAGHIRNRAMAEYADALIALWDGVSRGTSDMISRATERGLKVYVKRVKSIQKTKEFKAKGL